MTVISMGALTHSAGAGGFAGGAVLGAFAVGAVFLAGLALLGRSVSALCALLMVVTAGAAVLAAQGVIVPGQPALAALIETAFAASAIVFLSSSLNLTQRNAVLGGVMFAAALSALGVGIANIVVDGGLQGAARAVAGGGLVLATLATLFGALRGDSGARLILPGVITAASAPALLAIVGGGSLLAPLAFAAGVMGVGVIGAMDSTLKRTFHSVAPPAPPSAPAAPMTSFGASSLARRDPQPPTAETQLAQVLDYSGIAVWDWESGAGHQTPSFCEMMDAEQSGDFTPDAMRAFIHEEARDQFERKVFGAGDGGFDEKIKLTSGRVVRMRGARAVDAKGALERIVLFLEDPSEPERENGALKTAAASLAGAAALAGLRSADDGRLAAAVSEALDADKITARFQPIIQLKDRKTVGYEGLMFWPDGPTAPDGGSLSATAILRAARQAGRAPDLTRRMVRLAAGKIAEAKKEFGGVTPFAAFNVSASEILEPGFADEVISIIREFSLPSKALTLEVTETEKLSDANFSAVFDTLKAAGVSLAFDDFGAGFSCLANLHRFNFDYMKIDKSFIERMVDDAGAAKIVAALAGLARDLGMRVIAEGVESQADARAVEMAGCAYAQGFLFGAPVRDAAPASLPAVVVPATKPETMSAKDAAKATPDAATPEATHRLPEAVTAAAEQASPLAAPDERKRKPAALFVNETVAAADEKVVETASPPTRPKPEMPSRRLWRRSVR